MIGSLLCQCLYLEQYFKMIKETHQPPVDLSEADTVQVIDLDEIDQDFDFEESEVMYED